MTIENFIRDHHGYFDKNKELLLGQARLLHDQMKLKKQNNATD